MTKTADESEPLPATDARQRLLEAAEAAFAIKGYDAVSIRELCTAAGTNIAAVNYYFGDKANLYVEAVKYAHSCSIAEGSLPEWPAETPPRVKLEAFIRATVHSMHGPIRVTAQQLVMRELVHPSPATIAVVRQYIQPMAMALWEIVSELFPEIDRDQRLMIGFSIIGQCLFYRQNRAVSELLFGADSIAALDEAKVADHIIRFTLAAIGMGRPVGTDPPESTTPVSGGSL